MKDQIVLKKVSVHNLKDVNLTLNKNQLIVFTGVSGSGKSSLAFDTIYTEGQRRYIESLSTYARRHMHKMQKPEAELIDGLSPTIAIEQKTTGKNPRSTVGTMTGIYDFLRILYAKIGQPHCPISNTPLRPQSIPHISKTIQAAAGKGKILILAPIVENKKGECKEDLQDLLHKGFTRCRIDNALVDITDTITLNSKISHNIDVIVDRIANIEENKDRFTESLSSALTIGKGVVKIVFADTEEEALYSQHAFCKESGMSYPPLEPSDFSFNHPSTMCSCCQGLGYSLEFDLEKIIDETLSIDQDCCKIASSYSTVRYGNIYNNLAKLYEFKVSTPWKKLPPKAKEIFLYGSPQKWIKMIFIHPEKKTRWQDFIHWKGVLNEAKERYLQATSDSYKEKMKELMKKSPCSECKGSRIKPYPSSTTLGCKKIHELTDMALIDLASFFDSLSLAEGEKLIAIEPIKEIKRRLTLLIDVGLNYLCLSRTAPTLSGGEGQRVRLAAQIGSGLVGSTYILDEPSIGLHPRDSHKLLMTLAKLKDLGNTVIVVEHDEETIQMADTIVDVGPLAGELGGKIVACGSFNEVMQNPDSLTGGYLSGRLKIDIPTKRRRPGKEYIQIFGATHHNLKNINIKIPLQLLCVVTGVSGSGKSSLIMDILYPAAQNALQQGEGVCGAHKKISGFESLDKVISIDQSSIGRTPRSNPATYIKVFDEIRDLFSELSDSKAQGFSAGRFSFNVKEGSCPFCSGMGMTRIDLDFMGEEWSLCEHCQGRRFDTKTLSVTYKGKNIHDVLSMTVRQALEFFHAFPKIVLKLNLLMQVGLDYVTLGQPSPTLSGGEAQRIKLAKELSRPSTGKTLYILDEPTTGLHFHDIKKLIHILHSLVEKGNSVVVIEHNIDLIKTADWILDIGPEAGGEGGQLVAQGIPEVVAETKTATAKALYEALHKNKLPSREFCQNAEAIDFITVEGAEQNNLKNITTKIPRGKITVCTGPSGSGKSSLAFETVYAEGQRRYTESMSHYARQFIQQMPKPKVANVHGLSAAIAIEQKHHAGNPRSTVGTMTEIYDFLRVLYAHKGIPYCPQTQKKIEKITKNFVVDAIMAYPKGSRIFLLSPYFMDKSKSFSQTKNELIQKGFIRIRQGDSFLDLEHDDQQNAPEHPIHVVIDRLILSEDSPFRIFEAIEQAAKLGSNTIIASINGQDHLYTLALTVEGSTKIYPPITPQTFSFNSEEGMCPHCQGLGYQYGIDLESIPEIMEMTALDLVMLLWKDFATAKALRYLVDVFYSMEIDPETPLQDLNTDKLRQFFDGQKIEDNPRDKKVILGWRGIHNVLVHYCKSKKGDIKELLTAKMDQHCCPSCQGSRLNPLASNVKIEGVTLPQLCSMSIDNALHFIQSQAPADKDHLSETIDQIKKRLTFLTSIGLNYLCLSRSAPSLSGGETQRVRLSRQLGSGLTGCLYVLDEPTIGLHPKNNELLNDALKRLCALGNTLLLVEHDPMTLAIADHIIDFGPHAGTLGGEIIAEGTLEEIKSNPASLTGAYLSKAKNIPIPSKRRKAKTFLSISHANLHNLKDLCFSIPVGTITCLTGVSGAGKSTLAMDIIRPAVEKALAGKKNDDVIFIKECKVQGLSAFNKCLILDQNPAGHTNRADVSTYTELLTPLRYLLSSLPEAMIRGLQPKHFSFNHKKGMCSTCQGLGYKTVTLQFLPSVKVECEACKGNRLNPLSLNVTYKGKHLGHILKMTVDEAFLFFEPFPKIRRILATLQQVGLGYLQLGQEIATLSGGETQRIRLSKELSKRGTGKTLYIFDEPSIGLHMSDVECLIAIFHTLANQGNTIILIEHNVDLIKNADHIIDLGPGGGQDGGYILAQGTPEELVLNKKSITGSYLN